MIIDARKYYLKGLLNQLRYSDSAFKSSYYSDNKLYTQNYRLTNNQKEDNVKVATKIEILNIAIDYIEELENKVEELSYIQNIIDVAKMNSLETKI